MLKIKVKASSLTNLTDARYFAAREVEWLGFPLGTSGEAVNPLQVKAMAEWVDGVKIVGEFSSSSPEEILEVAEDIGLDAVQVGMFTSVADAAKLSERTLIVEIILEPSTSADELTDRVEAYAPVCKYFLINGENNSISWQNLKEGYPFGVDVLKNICEKYPVLVSMSGTPGDMDEMLESIRPAGLSFRGGEEEKVGYKSYDELDEWLDRLEIEE